MVSLVDAPDTELARFMSGATQPLYKIAAACDIHPVAFTRVLKGEAKATGPQASRIAEVLGVDTSDLLR